MHLVSVYLMLHNEYIQRIATAARGGGPHELHFERYVEALNEVNTGLMWTALTGTM